MASSCAAFVASSPLHVDLVTRGIARSTVEAKCSVVRPSNLTAPVKGSTKSQFYASPCTPFVANNKLVGGRFGQKAFERNLLKIFNEISKHEESVAGTDSATDITLANKFHELCFSLDESGKGLVLKAVEWLKSVDVKPTALATCMILCAMISFADPSLAATRSGGRVGGSNFSRPPPISRSAPPSYRAPAPSYRSTVPVPVPVPTPYYGGGFGYGWGLPFFPRPYVSFGFGSFIFPLFIMGAVAAYLASSRSRTISDEEDYPELTVAEVQVGLLSVAGKTLRPDLDRIARVSNTSTTEGLQTVLQETVLSLVRHPDYWVYAGGSSRAFDLESAEAAFNRLSLEERSKFGEESLTNVKGRVKDEATRQAAAIADDVGEYIVVTILVAADGRIPIPKKIRDRESLAQALKTIGSVSADELRAVEVLWTPQREGDVLAATDFMIEYPMLTRL